MGGFISACDKQSMAMSDTGEGEPGSCQAILLAVRFEMRSPIQYPPEALPVWLSVATALYLSVKSMYGLVKH